MRAQPVGPARPVFLALTLALVGARALLAQAGTHDSLRVLRFQPDSDASPVAPVVITFDRPVAPKLDESVDPRSVLTISPRRDVVIRWRDPSTIVAEFPTAWTPGTSFRVTLSSAVRSAGGSPMAHVAPREVRIQRSRLIHIGAPPETQVSPALVDTVPVIYAVYSSAVTAEQFTGRALIRPRDRCGPTDTLALEVVAIAKVTADSPAWLRDAGAYDRDRRLDSLRHVVTLRSPARYPRGCDLEVTVPTEAGASRTTPLYTQVRPPFGVAILSPTEEAPQRCSPGCRGGPLTLVFTRAVSGDALRSGLRVDGRSPSIAGNAPSREWTLRDTVPMGRPLRLELDRDFAAPNGERLGYTLDTMLTRERRALELGYVDGAVTIPRNSPRLLRLRVAYAESVVVVISRVSDSLRGRALMHGDLEFGRIVDWRTVASDSVVRVLPVFPSMTDERILDVSPDLVPPDWRNDALLLLRAAPRTRAPALPVPRQGMRQSPGSGVQELEAIEIRAPEYGTIRQPRFAVIQRTDLAAYAAQRGRALVVWVTRLESAKPVVGAKVRVFQGARRLLASASTDAGGLAELRLHERDWAGNGEGRHYVEVSEGQDRVLLALPQEAWMRRGEPPDTTEESNRGDTPPIERLHAAAFTDREVYRPGDRVYFKGIARVYRGPAGYAVPAGDSARWTITHYAGRGERIEVRSGTLGSFGTLVDSFQITSTARLGMYGVAFEVRDRDGWHGVADRSFNVAEYRVPEFSVTLSRDSAIRVYAGDTVSLNVAGRYLFGPPMPGAKVTSRVNMSPVDDEASDIAALRDFSVGRPAWWQAPNPEVQYANYERTVDLGSSGESVIRLPVPSSSGAGRMSISVSVQDVNRQSIASTLVVPVRAASVHIGVRSSERRWVWTTDDAIPLEVLVAGRDGVVRSGELVSLTGARILWQGDAWRSDTVWRYEVSSSHAPTKVSFAPGAAGWFEIVASVRDERGRLTESALTLYVSGPTREAPRSSARFAMRMDRGGYHAGDTAVALIEAPYDLSAIVTMRRELLLERRALVLHHGMNLVRIPVPVTAIGGAVIDVTAARPLGSTRMADGVEPYYYRESAEIAVSDSDRALRVRLVPDRARYAPGDSVRATLQVLDPTGRGRRGEAAVWAVDEGVLSLSGYKVPALLSQLLSRPFEWERRSSTLHWLLRASPPSVGAVYYHIYERGYTNALMELATAGGGYEGVNTVVGDPLRHRFVTTPFYAGNVLTDSTGHASVAFVLPDNVTTYRLFAAVVSDDAWAGATDTAIVSSRPLVIRAALPRIVRVGDSLLAGVAMTSERRQPTPVTLRIESNALRVHGSATVDETLAVGRATERRFSTSAVPDHGDTAVVRFRAWSASDVDAVEARLPVSAAGRPVARTVMGTTDARAVLSIPLTYDVDLERSRVVLQLGISPLPLVRRLASEVLAYPYDCTEQIASGIRALVARTDMQREVGDTLLPTDSERRQLQVAVNTLLARQRGDGGFGYWSRNGWTTPGLTAYALHALLEARRIGAGLPPTSIERATSYLRGAIGPIRNEAEARLRSLDTSDAATDALYAARLLRRLGAPDVGLETRIWERRALLGYADRLELSLLRAAAGDSAGARSLLSAAWRAARVEGRRVALDDSVAERWWIFRSVTAPLTTLLRATLALEPRHPLVAALFESLVQRAGSETGRWWTTVDLALASEAIAAASATLGIGRPHEVVITGRAGSPAKTIIVAGRGTDSLSLPIASIRHGDRSAETLQLTLTTTSPTYYALTLFEVPISRPTHPDDEGISLERWYERFEDGKPVTEVNEGELVRVRLRVTAPRDREFVVIDDALPAGLEAVDQSLRTSGSLPPYEGAPRLEADMREGPIAQKWMYGSWDGGWWTPWEHKEMRDDRVLWFARQLWRGSYQASYVARATTAGRFVRPPAHAEEMYNPAVHGRSDGGVFSVRSPDSAAPKH